MSFGGVNVCDFALLAMGGTPEQFSFKAFVLPWGRILDFNLGFTDGPQMNWRASENDEEFICGFGSQNSHS